MSEISVTETKPEVPVTTDAENEALIDAEKTFKVTLIGVILFGLASFIIIMRTRMG